MAYMQQAVYNGEDAAVISGDGKYRYYLERRVGPSSAVLTFIMLNPSTADAFQDDPTIRRCKDFARRFGCGRLVVVNLFGVRATDPKWLKLAEDPVGPDNKQWVDRAVELTRDPACPGMVVAAWGARGGYMQQDQTMMGWLDALGVVPFCLSKTAKGYPGHPLYIKSSAVLTSYDGRRL